MDPQQALNDLRALRDEPFLLECTALQAFFLLSTIQLACRHPGFSGPTRQEVEHIARQIQAHLTTDRPALAEITEQGWHEEYDAP